MPVVIINVAAVGVGELELRACDQSASHAVFLLDDQGTGPFVPKDKFGSLGTCGDLHALGSAVQHEAVHRLDLPRGDHGAGFQPFDHDLACVVGVEHTIAGADRRAGAVHYLKGHASQRLIGGPLDVLMDCEVYSGIVLKSQIVAAAGIAVGGPAHGPGAAAVHGVGAVFDSDRLGRGVENIAGRHLRLGHHHSAAGDEAGDRHRAVLAGGVAAQHSAVAVLDREFRTGNRLSGDRVQLGQGQTAQGFIQEGKGLRVQRIHRDRLGLGRLVDNIAGSRLGFLDHYGSGDAIDADFALVIGGVEAVAAQMTVVVINVAAVGVGDLELRAGDQSAVHAVFLLNDQSPGPLVPERELLHMARLDFDVLRGPIQNETIYSFDLAGNHGGAGFNTCQDNLTGFVGVVEAVIRPDCGPSAVHHPEGHAGQRLILGPLNKFPNNQRCGGGVVKIDSLRIVGIDNHGLRPRVGVDAVAGDRLQFRHHYSADHTGEDDLPVPVGVVDAVGRDLSVLVVHHLPIGVLDLELYALQGGVVGGA